MPLSHGFARRETNVFPNLFLQSLSFLIFHMVNMTETMIRQACAGSADPFASSALSPASTGAQPDLPVETILDEIARVADLPMGESTTLPAQAYTSQAFFNWEVENIFRKEWLCLGHVSQIPNAGDFLNLDLLGEPLIVIRDKGNDIRVLSRVCPHRAMDIMPPGFGYDGHSPADPKDGKPGCGNTRLLLCPYHFWTFELDGRLKACAEMQQAEGFNRDDWTLKPFRSEIWHGFIFVNLDGDAPYTVAEQYKGLGDYIAKWNLAEMEMIIANEWDCPFNWKVLTENFMESYHHAGAHAKTLQPMMPAKDTWTEPEQPHFIRCHLPLKEGIRNQIRDMESRGEQWDTFPPIAGLEGEERYEWGLFLGFPTFKFLVAPDCAIWYRTQPLGPNRMKLLTTLLVPPSTPKHADYSAMLEKGRKQAIEFHLEDMEVCTAVQRGFYASGYQRGRLSHLEMPIWLIQRYLAARSRGTWPTFDRPAAPGQR